MADYFTHFSCLLDVGTPENAARARFFGHVDTCGDDLIRKARALVAGEIADGHWN